MLNRAILPQQHPYPSPPSPLPTIRPRSNNIKHLQHEKTWMQHTSETDETFRTCTCNIRGKHVKPPNKTLATWNHLLQHKTETGKTFGTYYCNISVKYMQYPNKKPLQYVWKIYETFWTNASNIPLKHLQYIIYATCATSSNLLLQDIWNVCT
jgi:hypothetical protein